jgi:site-specific DNA-methyltransferase (adenine-specific)
MKVEIGDATLYLGDCLSILPSLPKVDAVITDPPYGINGGVGGDARDFGKGAYEAAFADTPEYISRVAVRAVEHCIYLAGAVSVTPGNRCLMLYPQPRDIGCFWMPAAATHGPWGMVTSQPILYYGKDWRAGRGALPAGRTVTEAAEKNGHPCPKPIEAWKWLTDKTCPPNGVALDPFMGSGTTGVACAQLGRKFIGIEIEPKYFDIACRRIEQAYAQGKLFQEPPPKQEQASMFGVA